MALEVPQLVILGEETTLSCIFDLEGDTLYSIKWYRDDLEFFRYVPSDKPPNQFFPLQGLDIDVSIFLYLQVFEKIRSKSFLVDERTAFLL